jgi:hypothetical protein
MTTSNLFSTLLAAALLSGCAASSGSSTSFEDITLTATQANQGQTGMAALIDKGDSVALDFTISGVPGGASSPLQLLSFVYPGTCSSLGAEPAYSMNQDTQVFQGQAGWVMSKTLPVSLGSLRASPFAIVVRSSPADGNQNIFCGDIR